LFVPPPLPFQGSAERAPVFLAKDGSVAYREALFKPVNHEVVKTRAALRPIANATVTPALPEGEGDARNRAQIVVAAGRVSFSASLTSGDAVVTCLAPRRN